MLKLLPPPPSATPRTIAITATTAMPAPIASARGDAWRGPRTPPTPLERTGGGVRTAVAAARRCSLALLPLGMRWKGSRLFGGPGGRQDQESNEKEEAGQGERSEERRVG